MDNKNSKSESYIVREAENVIEEYIEKRDLRDIENYYNLKEKYDRLKILSIALFITSTLGMLMSIFFA